MTSSSNIRPNSSLPPNSPRKSQKFQRGEANTFAPLPFRPFFFDFFINSTLGFPSSSGLMGAVSSPASSRASGRSTGLQDWAYRNTTGQGLMQNTLVSFRQKTIDAKVHLKQHSYAQQLWCLSKRREGCSEQPAFAACKVRSLMLVGSVIVS